MSAAEQVHSWHTGSKSCETASDAAASTRDIGKAKRKGLLVLPDGRAMILADSSNAEIRL